MGKRVLLFPGQGAQYTGMCADVRETFPAARRVFDEADRILGIELSRIIAEGPDEELGKTRYTQPATLVCEIAMHAALSEAGAAADMYAGFSMGEWAALVCAGVIAFSDALPLICRRAALMQDAVPLGAGGMAVVLGRTAEQAHALCARAGVYLTNDNCPGQIAVAGTSEGIDALVAIAEQESLAVKRLPISVPSHCPLMETAQAAFAREIDAIPFSDADAPIVMNATGLPETDGEAIRAIMKTQLTTPVRFREGTEYMLSAGADTFVEAGPGKTLTGLVKKTAKALGAAVSCYRTDSVEYLRAAEEGMKR